MPPERTWTIKADRGDGLTAREMLEALELAPPNSRPQVSMNWNGTVKAMTIQTTRGEEK